MVKDDWITNQECTLKINLAVLETGCVHDAVYVVGGVAEDDLSSVAAGLEGI